MTAYDSTQPGQPAQPDRPMPPSGQQRRRLVRSRDDRWISGVCGGVAEYLGIDSNLVRLIVVVGTIFGVGSLAVAYIVAWILMPEE
jgi:phage shock protein PspC (stress-responsive transcriptional regulator)